MIVIKGLELGIAIITMILILIVILINIFIYEWLYQYEPQAVYWINKVEEYISKYDEDKKLYQKGKMPIQLHMDAVEKEIKNEINKMKVLLVHEIELEAVRILVNIKKLENNIDENKEELNTITKIVEDTNVKISDLTNTTPV